MPVLIEAKDLVKYFPVKAGWSEIFHKERRVVHAVDGVSFDIENQETLGLVGESGCGKTTIGYLLLGLLEPTYGRVCFMGHSISNLEKHELRHFQRRTSMVFQDTLSSLNPRKTVRSILSEPYLVEHVEKEKINRNVFDLLELVGLHPAESFIDRYPHEFSLGQVQRIGIGRAIALKPKFIVLDEPVSSLDMSVRALILNLLKHLQRHLGLSYLFVTHDLAVVRSISRRVAVMYLGKIVELADTMELYENPIHPYTKAIFSATPIPNPSKTRARATYALSGEVSSAIDPPPGCRFHPRCQYRKSKCERVEPVLSDVGRHHYVCCHTV